MKKLILATVLTLVLAAQPNVAVAFSASNSYRWGGVAAPWTTGALLPEVQLNAQAKQLLANTNESIVGSITPVHPYNSDIVFVSTLKSLDQYTSVYTIYTYSLRKKSLWKYFEIRANNIDGNALGLEPVGVDGNDLILRRVNKNAPFFPCPVTQNWYLYSFRYDLMALNINPRVNQKQLNPYNLPGYIVNYGSADETSCRGGGSNNQSGSGLVGNSQTLNVGVTANNVPQIGNCQIYPADNPWNKNISSLNLRAESQSYMGSIGTDSRVKVAFGSDPGNGIPYSVIGKGTTWYNVVFGSGAKYSNPGPYPMPNNPLIEAAQPRRMIVVDNDSCYFYETVNPSPDTINNRWLVDLGAVFYLKANYLRPPKWPAATASGLPLLPGLVKYNEVAQGEIRHALIFTAPKIQKQFLAPATAGGSIDDGRLPPFGLRVRLRSDYDISRFPPQAKVIAEAMKKYGMFLGDYGDPWTILGTPDSHWDQTDLNFLNRIPGVMFEAVDTGNFIQLWE